MNIHVDIHTMLCETGSGSKHKAYIEAISIFVVDVNVLQKCAIPDNTEFIFCVLLSYTMSFLE